MDESTAKGQGRDKGILLSQAVLGLLILVCARLLRNSHQMATASDAWLVGILVASALAWLLWPRKAPMARAQLWAVLYSLAVGLAGVAWLMTGPGSQALWLLLAAAPGFWLALWLGRMGGPRGSAQSSTDE